MSQIQWKIESSIGDLYLTASERGLQRVSWDLQAGVPLANDLEHVDLPEVAIVAQAARELEEYLSGRRQKFGVALDAQGTDFQRQVWDQLAAIPYGHTISYTELASLISNQKAVRAVGSANGRNPLCIIVPCHRVIAANGTLGGYSGGLSTKEKLLELERRSKSAIYPEFRQP